MKRPEPLYDVCPACLSLAVENEQGVEPNVGETGTCQDCDLVYVITVKNCMTLAERGAKVLAIEDDEF